MRIYPRGKGVQRHKKHSKWRKRKEPPLPPPTVTRREKSSSIPRSLSRQAGREGDKRSPLQQLWAAKKISSHGQGKGREEYGATMCYTLPLPLSFLPPLFHSLILFFRWTRAE